MDFLFWPRWFNRSQSYLPICQKNWQVFQTLDIRRPWARRDKWGGPYNYVVPCPWNVFSACLSWARAAPRTLTWDSKVLLRPSDSLHDWTQLRFLNFLKFWLAGANIYSSCSYPREISYVSPLVHSACHLSIWSGLPLSLVSPCPQYVVAHFKLHLGTNTQDTWLISISYTCLPI